MQDLRYGVRMLAKHPWISLVAVITLALGMGVNAVIFSGVYSILLRPLPYADSDRLVVVGDSDPSNPSAGTEVSYPQFSEWKSRSRSFDGLAAAMGWNPTLKTGAATEQIKGSLVSSDFFQIFGMELLAGRALSAGEDQSAASPSVVIGESLWTRQFARSPAIIGRAVLLDDLAVTIVGIVSETSQYPPNQDVWASLSAAAPPNVLSDSFRRNVAVVGKLAATTDAGKAQAELRSIEAASSAGERRASDAGLTVTVTPFVESLIGKYKTGLLILQWAVAFVLLIACANLTNLLLAQTASRQKEFVIRIAIGATRRRLIVQLLTESFILSLLGAAAGLIAAQWTLRSLETAFAERLARGGVLHGIAVDFRVLIFMGTVTMLTAIIVGLTPALAASKPDLDRFLRSGSRGGSGSPRHRRIQSVLVVSEIALAMMLLVSAGLMIRTFNNLITADLGFRTDNVLTMRVSLPEAGYPDAASVNRFFTDVEQRVRALPGVESFAAVNYLPLIGYNPGVAFRLGGQPATEEAGRADIQPITPGYFEVLRIPLQRGRLLDVTDMTAASGVVVINDSFAKKFLRASDPIGATLQLGDITDRMQSVRVVGVVRDIHQWGILFEPRPEIYIPTTAGLRFRRTPYFVIGTTNPPRGLANAVRKEIEAIDSNQAVSSLQPLASVLYYSVERRRFLGLMLSFLGAVAMAMVSIAIYGVIAYSVIERRHEIGVRVALGAARTRVLRMVLRGGMHLALLGIVFGSVGAAVIMRLIHGYLYGVGSADPMTYIAVGALISVIAFAACYFPTRKATRVDPIIALRCE